MNYPTIGRRHIARKKGLGREDVCHLPADELEELSILGHTFRTAINYGCEKDTRWQSERTEA